VPAWATTDLRAGIIGTDTSHVPAFTGQFNKTHPEWRVKVVAAYKGGSPDLPTSADRVEKFAADIRDKSGVEIVGSIDELLKKVDVVLLESVDGRPHLAQVTPVLKAGKRVFIDKPLAASLDDARAIVKLSAETGTPFFSASSYRFLPDTAKLREAAVKAKKVQGSSPFSKLAHHPDLYFYGIHGVEALYAVMGRGCESVSRKTEAGADVTTGKWKDGRVGVYHGMVGKGEKQPIVRVFTDGGMIDSAGGGGYEGLVREIAEFFHTGKPPVDPAETLEVFEFMTAAQLSAEMGGAELPLASVRK
jgi:predicted dehydrogenase